MEFQKAKGRIRNHLRYYVNAAYSIRLSEDLAQEVRRDATIDWAERRNVQAKLKVNVKKTLAKYGYPPDQQALATDMVLEQAKRYGNEWSQKRAVYEAGGGVSLLD